LRFARRLLIGFGQLGNSESLIPAKILDERTANVLNASAQKGAAQFIIE
jgi:hypothetical protein